MSSFPDDRAAASAAPNVRTVIRAAIEDLGTAYGIESSVKLCGGRAITDRQLFSVPIFALGTDRRMGLASFLGKLSAPQDVAAHMTPYVGAAAHLHAGAEEGGRDNVCKVYLEFATPPPRDSDLVFVAAKWSATGRWMRSFYHQRCRDDLENLMTSITPSITHAPLAALVRKAEMHNAIPFALEVRDEGTPRRSLDLNFYDAQIAFAEAADEVMSLFEHLGPGSAEGSDFLKAHEDKLLGHIAVGRGRDNADFATVHFGAEPGT